MIRPLAFIALAAPAYAQDSAEWCNGLGAASVVPSDEGYAVSVTNAFCPRSGWDDGFDVITLEIDGLRIVVQVFSQPGRTPDEVVVLPPVGWVSDPAALTVEEHDTGVILLLPMGLS